MKNDSEASDPKHLQHFFFLFCLKCSKPFDNFTHSLKFYVRCVWNNKANKTDLLLSFKRIFWMRRAQSLLFIQSFPGFFSILSIINIICRIKTHSILVKTWKQNKKHHLELLDNII